MANENELLNELKEQIGAELKLLREADAPCVYSLAQTQDGAEQMESRVAEKVLVGMSIDQAITSIENEINPNRID